VIGFTLFLTTQVIQKRRYSVSVKQLSMGAYSTGMIAVVTALVLIINLFLGKLPSTMTVIDFSAQKLYSLT
jgi:ABC-2 type transport system permease protein